MKKFTLVEAATPFFCLPAVLEMTLRYYGYEFTQNDISKYFNVVTDKDTNDEFRWGITVYNNDVNVLFERTNIALMESFVSANEFSDEYFMVAFLKEQIKSKVVICGYNYASLFGKIDADFGHVSIIHDVSDDERLIEIVDPGPHDPGYKWVDAYDLFSSIKARRDGLWIIAKR